MSGQTLTPRAELRTLPCGCTVFTDPEWGVTRSYQKCAYHKSESGHSGLKHHEEMGAIKDGVVQHELYEKELMECVDIPWGMGWNVLEIGCGVGAYIPMFTGRAYAYHGLEPDGEVADFVSRKFKVLVSECRYEDLPLKSPYTKEVFYDLIFCAHAFEHMEDSPGMMAKAFSQLKPGGRLVLIVPNDDDLCNPDHLWMWNETTLRSALMRIGFHDIRMAVRQRVKHEKFIYTCASKP